MVKVRRMPRLDPYRRVYVFSPRLRVHLLTEALVIAGALRGRAHRVDVAVEGVLRVDAFLRRVVRWLKSRPPVWSTISESAWYKSSGTNV